ncbi:hypothetical protein GGE65_007772 [Skermanella aerolata]|uniref:hypothetical protein n=1 Tax=Skermanella aerolata TaxID=393310 RepID=UPI003D1A39F5
MNRTLSVICIVGFSMGMLMACTQTENLAKPAAIASDTVETQATVIAINRHEREVVLRGEDGTTMGYVLDDSVRNFDQINVGDTVTAEYYEAVAIAVEPASGKPRAEETGSMQRAPLGAKPGASTTRMREITATVLDIDYANRLVTLQGPAGQTRKVKVGPEVENFMSVKQGDQVLVRHTEAMAVAVTE